MARWIEFTELGVNAHRYEVELDVEAPVGAVNSAKFRYRVRVTGIGAVRPWWAGSPPLDAHQQYSRQDSELNLVWARNNPELFVDSVERFQEDHPADMWSLTADMTRPHYLTLTAVRK